MNNEIKEILDFKENADYKKLSCDEIKVLRDYITNLQQENEKWWAIIKDYEMDLHDLWFKNNELEKRIEKAVEYISSNCILSREWKEVEFCKFLATETITYKALSRGKIKELLNILNGDKSE